LTDQIKHPRFHDEAWVETYIATVTEKRPERIEMFGHIADLINDLPFPSPHVVELAAGSGMLAVALFKNVKHLTYESVDYSAPMVEKARESLSGFGDRVTLHQGDLNSRGWESVLSPKIHVIVSNMAIHDLGNEMNVLKVYRKVRDLLQPGGLLINADLVLTEENEVEDDKGKLKVSHHLELLKEIGLEDVQCSLTFGYYACVTGQHPTRTHG
jgi:SAM-dependent methyltransferase